MTEFGLSVAFFFFFFFLLDFEGLDLLPFRPFLDSSVPAVECCSNLWNLGLWWHAPYTSLHLLIIPFGWNLHIFTIARRSLAHNLHFLVPNVLTQAKGFPFQIISTVKSTLSLIVFFSVFAGTRFAKWAAKESDFSS